MATIPERIATLEERSSSQGQRLSHVEDVVDKVVEGVAHMRGQLIAIGAVIGILAGAGTAALGNFLP